MGRERFDEASSGLPRQRSTRCLAPALFAGILGMAACQGSADSPEDGLPSSSSGAGTSSGGGTSSDGGTASGGGTSSGGGSTSSGAASGGGSSGADCATAARTSELPDGAGGVNLEQVSHVCVKGFDPAASLVAFRSTLYPLLRSHCASCHSTETSAQAPILADADADLAHRYALTRVNFRNPEDSKLVLHAQLINHHCFGRSCTDSTSQLVAAVKSWGATVQLPEVPRPVAEGVTVSEEDVQRWIASDRAKLTAADAEFMVYASLHEMHNAGVSAYRLNVARAALSKALNATARWAPRIVNPVDIDERGMVYRFDVRDYWGFNKGVKALIFGGSDEDIFFGDRKDLLSHRFRFARAVSRDPAFAKTIWARVQQGSKEAFRLKEAVTNTKGFKRDYVEVSQLVYTLSRPDVYNAIMALPVYADELEDELGVVKDAGLASYRYVAVDHGITIAPRMMFRANTAGGGFYWKAFDIFTGAGQVYPFWEHPIPRFVSLSGENGETLSLLATLAQPQGTPPPGCDAARGGAFCTHYTGTGGVQQHASEMIWSLSNGLHAYAIYGGLNQRRTDAFTFIVVDPRRVRSASQSGGNPRGELRLTSAGSCFTCHEDGMKRENNDLRDRLEDGSLKASWTSDARVADQVRTLYPRTAELRRQIEDDRRAYLEAMRQIRDGMMLGEDRNLYVEPIGWTFEWAQAHYPYADTVAN